MAQRDKQKMLLSMDGMVSKLPDKGRSIEVRIEALEKEIAAAKAELKAKYGAGRPRRRRASRPRWRRWTRTSRGQRPRERRRG